MVLNRSDAQRSRGRWMLAFVHVAALAPLIVLLYDWAAGRLSFNPIRDITLRTGRYALIALIASLACTPVYLVSRFSPLLRTRRALGLYAFMYAGLHLLTFVGLDFGFNPAFIVQELAQRRFIQVGLASFLILLPLALTSSRYWMQRLGKNWKRLHRLVYLATPLALLHFAWVVKGDTRRTLRYGIFLGLFLLMRIPPIKRALARLSQFLIRPKQIEAKAAER